MKSLEAVKSNSGPDFLQDFDWLISWVDHSICQDMVHQPVGGIAIMPVFLNGILDCRPSPKA